MIWENHAKAFTSPHHKTTSLFNSLSLISLVWFVISGDSKSCKIKQNHSFEVTTKSTNHLSDSHKRAQINNVLERESKNSMSGKEMKDHLSPKWLMLHSQQQSYWGKYFQILPSPPLQITALESPTFATSRRSPTRIAVEAVDPASLFWVFSDFRNSESVWL